jgi:hypothetical protein
MTSVAGTEIQFRISEKRRGAVSFHVRATWTARSALAVDKQCLPSSTWAKTGMRLAEVLAGWHADSVSAEL